MTVLEIGENKLIINLTHTEVVCCFDSYERLSTLSGSVKTAVSALIESVAQNHKPFKNGRVTAQIKVVKNNGCEITLTMRRPTRKSPYKYYSLDFSDSEAMTGAIIHLYRKSLCRKMQSFLYKAPFGYRLTLRAKSRESIAGADEFYQRLTVFETYEAPEGYIPLIAENAIEKYGKIFSKGI